MLDIESKVFIDSLILEGTNSSQLEAITTTEGPLLIIAGPGSGKTRTLVERIVYLISKGVPVENIFVSTFTEKAARELITRVSNRLLSLNYKVNINEMYIGTLHSIFLRILDEYREYTLLNKNYRILDKFEQTFLVFRNLSEYMKVDDPVKIIGGNFTSKWDKAQNLIYYISRVAEESLDVDVLCNAQEPEIKAIGNYYKIYQAQLLSENALDFTTIQTEALKLLKNHPSVLEELQNKIKYVMVDEYQDTNTIQEEILLLLASKDSNICVVGDDDQGLYRFRGATIRNILEFSDNFKLKQCKKISLTTNYRSHPDIINFYNEWMNMNEWEHDSIKYRYDKIIKPREENFKPLPAVIKVSNDVSFEEYCDEILRFIKKLESSKKLSDYNQIAFLFNSVKHKNVLSLAKFLEENGISVFSPRSALFFQRDEVQLIIGAIIFIFPTLFEDLRWNDTASLSIWDTYFSWKKKFADAVRKDPEKHKSLLKWCQKRAKEHLTLTSNTDYAFAALIYQLLEFPMFSEYINVDLNSKKTDLRAAYNISQIIKLLFKFEYLYNITVLTPKIIRKTLQDFFNTYLRFIIEGGLEEYEDFDDTAPSGSVSFMTIHQAKGLEFPIVLVDSLHHLPRKRYDDVEVILQENYYHKEPFEPIEKIKYYDFWRLYYTAFSRPKNLLVLTTHERKGRGRSPSKYFEEIYKNLINWDDHTFNFNNLELDIIRPVNIKKEYSFTSHVLLYENCPLQYKFYKELDFTPIRIGGFLGGSLLHQTIEDINKAALRDEIHTLTDENITSWFNTNYYNLSKSQRSYLHEAQQYSLLAQILRYRDNHTNKWHLIKEVEVDVSLVKENYILKGIIDLIEGENNTVELIDFKSGDKPDINSTTPKTIQVLDQYRRQLEVYAHIVEERTGHVVSKMHLYYPKEESGSPYISFNVNRGNYQETIKNIDDVVSKIETKDYNMTNTQKSEKQCSDCDMRFYCNPQQYNN